MVKVLPEPVTPSSTWSRSRALTPATSSSIARGLIAARLIFRDELELDAAFRLFRARRPVRHPRRLVAQIGIAAFEQVFQRRRRRRDAARAAGEEVAGASAKPIGGRAGRRRVEQRGEMVAERLQFGLSGFGWGGFSRRFGHGRNMGRAA